MNYLPLEVEFETIPQSIDNLLTALEIIGRIDPLGVKYFSMKFVKIQNPTVNNFRNRGILNVRKLINNNLGKNGKIKNRMVKKVANVVSHKYGESILLKAVIPYKTYFQIIDATYYLLSLCGIQNIKTLSALESSDNYPAKVAFQDVVLKTVSPIQTAIILCSNERDNNQGGIIDQLRNKIS